MVLIYVSLPEQHIAEKLAETLLKERLANHINILPKIRCLMYNEKTGQVQHSGETILLIKTKALLYRNIEDKLNEMHLSVATKVFSVPITQISHDYYDQLVEGILKV